MKSLVILTSVLAVAIAQRPGYLGSGPVGYPGLGNRFKEDSSTASTPAVVNRLGEASSTTSKIPVDARGDAALVNRLNQWPRENRPFWILNADHIEAQRNTQSQQQPNLPSRFGEGTGSTSQPDFSIQNGVPYDNYGNPIQI